MEGIIKRKRLFILKAFLLWGALVWMQPGSAVWMLISIVALSKTLLRLWTSNYVTNGTFFSLYKFYAALCFIKRIMSLQLMSRKLPWCASSSSNFTPCRSCLLSQHLSEVVRGHLQCASQAGSGQGVDVKRNVQSIDPNSVGPWVLILRPDFSQLWL